MVKITNPPGPTTTQTIDEAPAAPTVEAPQPADQAKAIQGARPRDALETSTPSRGDTASTHAQPTSEAGGGALRQIAELLEHPLFGSPNVAPARGAEMETITPDPAALAVDVPQMLQEAYAKLAPDSPHAQAIRDLSAAFGGLEHLAPENYLQGHA